MKTNNKTSRLKKNQIKLSILKKQLTNQNCLNTIAIILIELH